MKALLLAVLLLFIPSLAAAEISVEDAWVRMPPPVADTAAGYLTLKNSGEKDVEVVAVESSAAAKPEFHSMSMHDGMMHMMKMDKVVVPAHGELRFETGGNHLMLTELTGTLNAGDHVMMTITFSDGSSVMVHAEVRDMRSQDSGGYDDHGGSHGEHHGH
ncbi:copper chaperone PCu(A)C [Mariprofundus sp. KV]|uniref:copper chaperone PCu(A)C n=1 Tax=Mariprofundus sp. KV TaxID=2608715 RepID=UPI0015A099A3|nr:copper chaperone PCu(A)C [Mariprofundus sp. KV]